jgi:hypothetical protein
VDHCARQSTFALALKHPNPEIVGGAGAAYCSGSVGAAVIDDDELAIYRDTSHRGAKAFQKNGNISCFVESRNYQA